MFTGIIEATATVQSISDSGLVLARPALFDDLKIGCSIAVSGACLSVTKFDASSVSFDVVPTTFAKTKLGLLKIGDVVNLERAMKADGRFEGHIVQGHCEGTGTVIAAPRFMPPPPAPPPGSVRRDGAAGRGENDDNFIEDERSPFNHLMGRVLRSIGDFRFPVHSTVDNARSMRKEPTRAEEKLWQQLRRNQIGGLYFRRQRPIGAYIVDFYCEEAQLAIEIDGGVHREMQEYDRDREECLSLRGVRLIRFSNDQVFHDLKGVLSKIEKSASLSPLTTREQSERGVRGEGLREGALNDGDDSVAQGRAEEGARMSVRLPNHILPFVVLHGSITLDGVALTVADIKKSDVAVALIPHTLANTTLGQLQTGDSVNVETDILGKYILSAHGRI